MNNILNTSNGVATLISRTNDGTNALTINGTTLDESDWIGSGNYTFTDGGQTFTIKQISENTGNIILKIVDDYNYELAKISEQAEDLAELAEQVAALQNTKQNNLIAGDNIELVDNQDNTTTISSTGGGGGAGAFTVDYSTALFTGSSSSWSETLSYTIPSGKYAIAYFTCAGSSDTNMLPYVNGNVIGNGTSPNGNGDRITFSVILKPGDIIAKREVTWSPGGTPYIAISVYEITFVQYSYSTDEHVIGTWIDGSTLYEKSWILSTPVTIAYNAWTSLGITYNGISKIMYSEANNESMANISIIATADNGDIRVMGFRNVSGVTVKYLTLRYTKTS